uniref:G-protein coupled receptors family 1 profile domain-containing protein n=1 Tax=Timema bartmani TaxID=61472 RepID=A0A7R9F2X2_9NEOP|nr:unnamed protein product [Timema bartmani]
MGRLRFESGSSTDKEITNTQPCGRFAAPLEAAVVDLLFPCLWAQLMIFRVATGPFYEEFQQCVTYGFYTEPWQEQLYTTFSLVCMFVMPLIILVSTYVCTVITIARTYSFNKVCFPCNTPRHATVNPSVEELNLLKNSSETPESLRIWCRLYLSVSLDID